MKRSLKAILFIFFAVVLMFGGALLYQRLTAKAPETLDQVPTADEPGEMDPGEEMLGVARMISAGKGWEGLRDALKEGLDLSRKGVPFWAVEPADSTVGELLSCRLSSRFR